MKKRVLAILIFIACVFCDPIPQLDERTVVNNVFLELITKSVKELNIIEERKHYQKILLKELESYKRFDWYNVITEMEKKLDPFVKEALYERISSWTMKDTTLLLPWTLPNRY